MSSAAGLPAFLVASAVMAMTPDSGVACLVGRRLTHGRVAGFASLARVKATLILLGLLSTLATPPAALRRPA